MQRQGGNSQVSTADVGLRLPPIGGKRRSDVAPISNSAAPPLTDSGLTASKRVAASSPGVPSAPGFYDGGGR